MTHERDPALRLPPDEARCEPSALCTVRSRCARYIASIPASGARMDDFSLHAANGGTALCPGYLDAAAIRKQAMPAPARRVHPPIGSAS